MENFVVEINRHQKALKIQKILEDFTQKPLRQCKILDIGCGNGLIAACLAGLGNEVTAVDVADQRDPDAAAAYKFVQISDERLPFADGAFDIVISNHVIEHVGDHALHLAEIARVVKPEGLCYLATPNRYFPYEVHYKLLFLHWLPYGAFDKTLKKMHKYSYPVRLLGYWGLKQKCRQDFVLNEYTHLIIKDPERFAFGKIPVLFSKLYCRRLNFISPTLIFVLRKKPYDYNHS